MSATLAHVRSVYTELATAMGDALRRELGGALIFTQPLGGLFFWANLKGAGGKLKDDAGLAKLAIEQGVTFVLGGTVPCKQSGHDSDSFEPWYCGCRKD